MDNKRRSREDALAARRMVDAIRELRGQSPLYNLKRHDTHSWLTEPSLGYYEVRGVSSRRKGLTTGG